MHSLVTGVPLLDHFATVPIPEGARLLYLDTELGPRRLARWLAESLPGDVREQVVWSIAGRAGTLDVRQDAIEAPDGPTGARRARRRPAGVPRRRRGKRMDGAGNIEENGNASVRAFCEALHAFSSTWEWLVSLWRTMPGITPNAPGARAPGGTGPTCSQPSRGKRRERHRPVSVRARARRRRAGVPAVVRPGNPSTVNGGKRRTQPSQRRRRDSRLRVCPHRCRGRDRQTRA